MTVVIAYDVQSARFRRRVTKLLQSEMSRVQKSVFEGRLTREAAEKLFAKAEREIEEGDNLRMYVITANGLDSCRAKGGVNIMDQTDCWIV